MPKFLPWLAPGLALLLAAAPRARADVLELADGRLVEGSVTKEADGYRVRSRFGESTIPLADVKAWRQEKPVDDQVRERLAALGADDAEGRAAVALWLRDLGRDEEARALAEAVLEIDPECARAHEILGHVRHQGTWRTPDEARRAEGLEKHGDRWYTPAEWENLGDAARSEAEEAGRREEAKRRAAEVNEAVRLMTSPDPLVRARGRKRLEALAKEFENPRLLELVKRVEEYVAAGDALAAAAADPDRAMVLGELRLTYSKLKRPIQVFETALASGPIGGAAPVRIQLPELEVIKINTTVGIPAVVK